MAKPLNCLLLELELAKYNLKCTRLSCAMYLCLHKTRSAHWQTANESESERDSAWRIEFRRQSTGPVAMHCTCLHTWCPGEWTCSVPCMSSSAQTPLYTQLIGICYNLFVDYFPELRKRDERASLELSICILNCSARSHLSHCYIYVWSVGALPCAHSMRHRLVTEILRFGRDTVRLEWEQHFNPNGWCHTIFFSSWRFALIQPVWMRCVCYYFICFAILNLNGSISIFDDLQRM